MSPEQARGKAVDRRTDVWAFGCVLYEMLTGRKAFEGETVSDIMASVLTREPDWSALPADRAGPDPGAPAALPAPRIPRRLHDIADARIEIEDAAAGQPEQSKETPAPAIAVRRGLGVPAAVAMALAAAAVAVLATRFLRAAGPRPDCSRGHRSHAVHAADGSLRVAELVS